MSETEEDAQFYRDTESVAFRKIDDTQLGLLEPLGERRVMKQGEMIYRAGQRDLPLTMVLRGEAEVYEDATAPCRSSPVRARAISSATSRCSKALRHPPARG